MKHFTGFFAKFLSNLPLYYSEKRRNRRSAKGIQEQKPVPPHSGSLNRGGQALLFPGA